MSSKQSMVALLLVVAALVPWIQCSIQLEQQHDDDNDNYAMSDEFIDKINSIQFSWKAGRNFDPKKTTLKDVRSLCGVKDDLNMTELLKAMHTNEPLVGNFTIPTEFDARKTWPNCTSIGLIRDQGSCESGWAVSVASAISDRICIISDEKLNVQISAEDLLSCCKKCGDGCREGNTAYAWKYYNEAGLVSGGGFNSGIGCKPYSIPNCNRKGTGDSYPPCRKVHLQTPKCNLMCTNSSYLKPYKKDKFYGNCSLRWLQRQIEIQLELMTYGSVTAMFKVYEDFSHYKSGVYVKTAGEFVNKHAVRVIGWGVENGTPYWLVANSWNQHWGDQGIIKFRRGTNECGIESLMTSGMPML